LGTTGVEAGVLGDHFEVDKAAKDKGYCKGRWDILQAQWGCALLRSRRTWWGQAVCD